MTKEDGTPMTEEEVLKLIREGSQMKDLFKQLNESLKEKISLSTLKEVFAFLNAVRDTGLINMVGASPCLEKEFGFHYRDARKIHIFWLKNCSKMFVA